ncbi:MAG TPA: histidine kinase [Clostridiales bacterium]|nr:histidine kinase [Clostridiales bacterium]HOL90787.1 histidine kinase [Clostridiales bacterium]HPP34629.1 histidine kinase [Clostridiales bacterium]
MGKLWNRMFNSIQTRIIAVFVLTMALTSAASIFVLGLSRNIIGKMDEMFEANVEIENFLNDLHTVDAHLVNYLVTSDSDSLLYYYRYKEIFSEKVENMFSELHGIYDQNDLIYKDIKYMAQSYFNEADAAVGAKMIDNADEYIARYAEANRINSYIQMYAGRLNLNILDKNTTQYLGMSENLSKLHTANLVLTISVILLNVLVIAYMTYNMTKPIIKLAHSAEEISRGNFDAEDIEVVSQDELSIMANAFNAMKHSIRNYIRELHNKADTEAKLLEQQIENLRMQSLLADAEMKALQMQINPHFLFNTLNAGVQLATLEGADRTSAFLDSMAKILRYNVKSLDRTVRIKDEIDTIKAYEDLFMVRFGDSIRFEYNIDRNLLGIKVPPLIIQPLVENATIHGIGNMENGGVIRISLERCGDIARIIVEDNGAGMDEDTRQKILKCQPFGCDESGHMTGIGIYNVVQRLRLFFNCEDVVDVESAPCQGTKVVLKIPCDADNGLDPIGTEGVVTGVQPHGV